jgi:predicted double-glycine peptidase
MDPLSLLGPMWWLRRRGRIAREQLCYPTKGEALEAFKDANLDLVEASGGLENRDCRGYDSINERYELRGRRQVCNLGDAMWAAMPAGRPFCLDRLDIEALNDTTPGREHGGFRLPDQAAYESAMRKAYENDPAGFYGAAGGMPWGVVLAYVGVHLAVTGIIWAIASHRRVGELGRVAPYQQKFHASCGSACLLAVLRHHNADRDVGELEVAARMSFDSDDGSTEEDVARAAREFGLSATVLERPSLEDLVALLARGLPVILAMPSWTLSGKGHFVVLTALDDAHAEVMDPNVTGNWRRLPLDEFVNRWASWTQRGVLVAPPGLALTSRV